MSERLAHLALTTSLIGLLALGYAGEILEPPTTAIKDLHEDSIGKRVKVKGTITDTHQFKGGSILLTLQEDDTSIPLYLPYHVTQRLREPPPKNSTIEAIADLQIYRGQLEPVVEEPEHLRWNS